MRDIIVIRDEVVVDVKMRAINNSRTPDGEWVSMDGCHCCKKVASSYILLNIYQNSSRIAKHIKLCKSCLCNGIESINQTLLDQAKTRVE